jgi:hypothetical protein
MAGEVIPQLWTFGDEDVAPALLVERPRDPGTSGSGGKLSGNG